MRSWVHINEKRREHLTLSQFIPSCLISSNNIILVITETGQDNARGMATNSQNQPRGPKSLILLVNIYMKDVNYKYL